MRLFKARSWVLLERGNIKKPPVFSTEGFLLKYKGFKLTPA